MVKFLTGDASDNTFDLDAASDDHDEQVVAFGKGGDDTAFAALARSAIFHGGIGDDRLDLTTDTVSGTTIDFDGGGDTDTAELHLEAVTEDIILTQAAGSFTAGGLSGSSVESLEIYAGSGNDEITLDDGLHHVEAGDGNDTIALGQSLDPTTATYADGGAGEDTITAGLGLFELHGGDDDDRIYNIDGNDGLGQATILDGGAGSDVVKFGGGVFTVTGGEGDDEITNYLGNDGLTATSVDGGAGEDQIDLGHGLFDIQGGDDNDQIYNIDGNEGTGPATTIDGGGGDDQITFGKGLFNVDGGDGNDIIANSDGGDIAEFVGNDGTTPTIIDGGDGDDQIMVGLGAYDISGGAGNDDIDAYSDHDSSFAGGAGDDIIDAGSGNDIITDGVGDDLIFGGAGDDQINIQGDGTATVFGDEGNDRLSWTPVTAPHGGLVFTVDLDGSFTGLAQGAVGFAGVSGDGVENFTIESHGDGSSLVQTGGGDDVITTGNGADVISPGAGSDIVHAGGGDDYIVGGDGHDELYGEAGSDLFVMKGPDGAYLDGGAGDDGLAWVPVGVQGDVNFYASSDGSFTGSFENLDGTVTLEGVGVEHFLVAGDAGDDTITTADGMDAISGGDGADLLHGGGGNDELYDGEGFSELYGDAGDDVIVIQGPDGALVHGGDGDDLLAWAPEVDDGSMQFTALADGSFTGTIDASAGTVTVSGDGVENFEITGTAGDDTITTSDGDDAVYDGGGEDVVHGGGGDDHLEGGFGFDQLYGEDGDDRLVIAGPDGGSVDGGAGNDIFVWQSDGPAGGMSFKAHGDGSFDGSVADPGGDVTVDGTDVEAFRIYGTDQNDQIITGGGNDVIVGGDGDDHMDGRAGDDIIRAGGGIDTVFGGAGDDRIILDGVGDATVHGGDDHDSFEWDQDPFATDDMLFSADAGGSFKGSGPGDILGDGVEEFHIHAGAGDDIITTATGDDVIAGGGGINELDGGGGDDRIESSGRFDTVHGGDGNDHLTWQQADASSALTFQAAPDGSFSGSDDDVGARLSGDGVESFSVYGGIGDDTIATAAGDDHIDGGSGNDMLSGGAGNDVFHVEGGDATIDGGADDDLLELDRGDDTDGIIFVATGTSFVGIGISGTDVERFDITGGWGDDIIVTGAHDDVIDGGDGDDRIGSAGGHDAIDGGAGDDIMVLAGPDGGTVEGGEGADSLEWDRGDATGDIRFAVAPDGSFTGGNADGMGALDPLTLLTGHGVEAFDITGGAGNDVITTGAGEDQVHGGLGNDVIDGGGGGSMAGHDGDQLYGGGGDDLIITGGGEANQVFGEAGDDTIVVGSADGAVIDGGGDQDTVVFSGAFADYSFEPGSAGADRDVTHVGSGQVTHVQGVETYIFDSTPYALEDVPCFLTGTLIAVPGGQVPVERLAIGDAILTLAPGGGLVAAPVRWIGHRRVATRFADPIQHHPVRIAAGALDEASPARDLMVSPDHGLLLDGLLVQAGALVNGSSVTRLPAAALPEVFTYFHIETERHALVLAEGALAETFVDNVTRRRFDNYAEYEALFGGETGAIAELDHPRAMSRRQLPQSLLARLSQRAARLAAPLARLA